MEKSPKPTQAPTSGSRSVQASSAPRALGIRQGVDDPAEQYRFDELRGGQRHVGEGERPAEARLGPEQCEHANIETQNLHEADTTDRPHRERHSSAMRAARNDPESGQWPFVEMNFQSTEETRLWDNFRL